MTSNPGKQTIVIHILPNISRSKSNQIKEFGQLIDNNRELFLLKNDTKSVEEKLLPNPFLKN